MEPFGRIGTLANDVGVETVPGSGKSPVLLVFAVATEMHCSGEVAQKVGSGGVFALAMGSGGISNCSVASSMVLLATQPSLTVPVILPSIRFPVGAKLVMSIDPLGNNGGNRS